jgi:hypothetical protein
MSKKAKPSARGAMLELWRPPQAAGEPLGCLATTYTFAASLFDEQCLARFLDIESEPNREDLAFLVERETRLGTTYAGVLVDHTQAGVAHSLRWDVLPVRIPGGIQHGKLSLLAWRRHIRVIVASANLTEQGYRTNREVAASVDLTPEGANLDLLAEAIAFLRRLIGLVPGASMELPEVKRAEEFLGQVERQARDWNPTVKTGALRQRLVCTLPTAPGVSARSSLEETIEACRTRGSSPRETWVASPFYDADAGAAKATAALCKLMARGDRRDVWFAVPALPQDGAATRPRLAAPKALLDTPAAYGASVGFETLPDQDEDKNSRIWHAKLLVLRAAGYSAALVGSSNFTCAGMGVGGRRNAEANLLTIADEVAYAREVGQLTAVWPEMARVEDPHSAEWAGSSASEEEEDPAAGPPLPAGFLSATYRAGEQRRIILRLDPSHLPAEWSVHATGKRPLDIASAGAWRQRGGPASLETAWELTESPEKLLVRWPEGEALMPLNVEEARSLPAPSAIEQMSADDMLLILAASDPSAAFRAWARRLQASDNADADLDSATPIDLDPLRRYDLHTTFLHRVRRRASVLAQLRANLQRPVWSQGALEWRLRGMVGVEALGQRLVSNLRGANGSSDEALLTLADFVIVLREVEYQPEDGALSAATFEGVYRPFLAHLAAQLVDHVDPHRARLAGDLVGFWDRVVDQCRN